MIWIALLQLIMVVEYVDVDLRWRGRVEVVRAVRGRYAKPTALKPFRGRFTAILAAGKNNVAEINFDFPLLAAAETPDMTAEAQVLGEALRRRTTSTTRVRLPWPEAAPDQLMIYDNLLRTTVTVPLAELIKPPALDPPPVTPPPAPRP